MRHTATVYEVKEMHAAAAASEVNICHSLLAMGWPGGGVGWGEGERTI